jgi:sialidase-1
MMFSDDDGKTWTKPVVIARITEKVRQLTYPQIFEAAPGELWIITAEWAGYLRIRVNEKDYI